MNRQCGDCQLCCKLLPVVELDKKAGQRCQHQRHGKGCMIYPDRPMSCRLWSCAWLRGNDTADLRRPDRSHYVVDAMIDHVTIDQPGEPSVDIPVIQVWVDPTYPDAHRDPELRAYLALQAEKHGYAALIRWDSRRAMTLFPPAVSHDKEWHEITSQMEYREQHGGVGSLGEMMLPENTA